jgi:hypothetical protein
MEATMPHTPNLTIIRDRRSEWATLGRMSIDGEIVCHTLERPWLDNKRRVSCIPAGSYHGAIQHSPRFQRDLPELLDVPGRSQILIHAGNTADDTEGCILVGMERHDHEDRIMQSRPALALVLERLAGCAGFTLTVEEG